MTAITRVYIGLGANLDDPRAQVRAAGVMLAGLPHSSSIAYSSLYRSAPVGVTAQPDFINAVCSFDTTLAPHALLAALFAIEQSHGRVRGGVRGGPRTLDLDLLLYGAQRIEDGGLMVPHPRLHERAFVLLPLAELDERLTIPGQGQVGELLAACAAQRVEKLENW